MRMQSSAKINTSGHKERLIKQSNTSGLGVKRKQILTTLSNFNTVFKLDPFKVLIRITIEIDFRMSHVYKKPLEHQSESSFQDAGSNPSLFCPCCWLECTQCSHSLQAGRFHRLLRARRVHPFSFCQRDPWG